MAGQEGSDACSGCEGGDSATVDLRIVLQSEQPADQEGQQIDFRAGTQAEQERCSERSHGLRQQDRGEG